MLLVARNLGTQRRQNGCSAPFNAQVIFVMDDAVVQAHNSIEGSSRQGMPTTLPVVSGCSVVFSNNNAPSQAGTDTNNHDIYGVSRSELVEPCKDIFMDGFE